MTKAKNTFPKEPMWLRDPAAASRVGQKLAEQERESVWLVLTTSNGGRSDSYWLVTEQGRRVLDLRMSVMGAPGTYTDLRVLEEYRPTT